MKIEIELSDYLTHEEIKKIAIEEVSAAFRNQFQKESDVERVITNLSYEFVKKLVDEQWDGNFTELLRKRINDVLSGDMSHLRYLIFRRKDVWDRTESPAVGILDEELRNSRPLIKKRIEEEIEKYPFDELKRDEIGGVIYEVIMEKILKAGESE